MLRDFIKAHTTAGLRRAVWELIEEIRIQRRHRIALKHAKKYTEGGIKLNLGCGSNLKEGWLNVDLTDKADLQLDLREAMPFESESVSQIYSEHFFEHLEYPAQALIFLTESIRVMKAGGLFSVGVPDTQWPLESYVNDDEEYFLNARKIWHPEWCNTRMHNLNYHFRQEGAHKYAYDFETLARILKDAGFVSITRRDFDPDLDDETRKLGTLYIDARKPENN